MFNWYNFEETIFMYAYDTVVAAINGLKERGFVHDFHLTYDQLTCDSDGSCLNPEDFEITEVHRFEGDTNPSDEDVVYGIVSKSGSLKGILSSAFGTYAEAASPEMLSKLSMHHS